MSAYHKNQVNTEKKQVRVKTFKILDKKHEKNFRFRFRLKPNLRVGTEFGTLEILIGIEHPESAVTFI